MKKYKVNQRKKKKIKIKSIVKISQRSANISAFKEGGTFAVTRLECIYLFVYVLEIDASESPKIFTNTRPYTKTRNVHLCVKTSTNFDCYCVSCFILLLLLLFFARLIQSSFINSVYHLHTIEIHTEFWCAGLNTTRFVRCVCIHLFIYQSEREWTSERARQSTNEYREHRCFSGVLVRRAIRTNTFIKSARQFRFVYVSMIFYAGIFSR